jgi:hypothetical protein
VQPLPLAGGVTRKAVWDGYGFARVGKGHGLPLTGEVLDPDGRDTRNSPAIIVYSNQVAAGMASPLHGFSGSPIVVNDAVVGHLKRFVSDPDDELRPAFGLVYACPSSAVLKLLGTRPEIPIVEPPVVPTLHDRLPRLAEGEYHVFLSYRSTDRSWATELVARLEGAGFRVFIDQAELQPGQTLIGQLQTALTKTRAGVVLISRNWLESRSSWTTVFFLQSGQVRDTSISPTNLDPSVTSSSSSSMAWPAYHGQKRNRQPPELAKPKAKRWITC